ncbi:hypothetical protein FRC05_005234 [Tulasnella sp. 425]|nr:hypothetical protein FRC05_005234 [Tulasnella sp. 425]
MHSALQLSEIIYLIFKRNLSKHDLFNCALVCRLWGIWASDVLWRTCPVPLHAVLQPLGHMPKATSAFDEPVIASINLIPEVEIGNIDESQWRLFLELSNKITRVIIDCGLQEVGLKHIKFAKQKFNGEPFSHLETLRMEFDDGHHETLRLVTVPSVTSVILSPYTLPKDTLDWVANDMPEIASSITHLGISLNPMQAIEISRHSALKHLELRSIDVKPRFWESLASCKRLTKIAIMDCFFVGELDDTSVWRLDTVLFPALRTLRIRYGHARVLLCLIPRSRMPMLECVRWDEYSGLAKDLVDRIVAPLKLYSPKLDTNTLYYNDTTAHGDDSDDSGFDW